MIIHLPVEIYLRCEVLDKASGQQGETFMLTWFKLRLFMDNVCWYQVQENAALTSTALRSDTGVIFQSFVFSEYWKTQPWTCTPFLNCI